MFCGLCEDACPVDALELTQDFELASYTREGAIWDRQMLEEGRAQADCAVQIEMLTWIPPLLFTLFALVLGGAILTITRRSAIHSAICLIVSLVGVAGLYLLQKAEFLFAVQIILVYRRHHGAVPVRDHAGEPGRAGQGAAVQRAMVDVARSAGAARPWLRCRARSVATITRPQPATS